MIDVAFEERGEPYLLVVDEQLERKAIKCFKGTDFTYCDLRQTNENFEMKMKIVFNLGFSDYELWSKKSKCSET